MNVKFQYNESIITIQETSLCTVKFTDGVETDYSTNIIAENMWEQCGNEGNNFQLIKELSKTNHMESNDL